MELSKISTATFLIIDEINAYNTKITVSKSSLNEIFDGIKLSNKCSFVTDEDLKANEDYQDTVKEIDNYISLTKEGIATLNSYLDELYIRQGFDNSVDVNSLINVIQNFISENNTVTEFKYFSNGLNCSLNYTSQIRINQNLMNEEISNQTALLNRVDSTVETLNEKTKSGIDNLNEAIMSTSKTKLYVTIGLQLLTIFVLLI